jgi:hypothetical protein
MPESTARTNGHWAERVSAGLVFALGVDLDLALAVDLALESTAPAAP